MKLHQNAIIREQAWQKLLVEDTVKVPYRYKTLFDGLKRNHERNVAVVHPLLFLLRRIIFAFMVVFMSLTRITGLFIFTGCTLFMLGYACLEHQWTRKTLNMQHIMNETAMYIFCLFLVYFSFGETSVDSRFALGYVFIMLFFIWSALNFTLIFWQSVRRCKMLLKRYKFRLINKRVKKSVSKTVKDLKEGMPPINFGKSPAMDKEFSRRDDKDDDDQFAFDIRENRTKYGGFNCSILSVKADQLRNLNDQGIDFLRVPSRQFSDNQVVPV